MGARSVSAPLVHAARHAPGGADEVANLWWAIRYQRLMLTLGYTDETGPLGSANASSLSISGRLYGMSAYYFAGEVVSNLICAVNTAATAATLVKLGVMSSAGGLLAQSANVSASFGSPGKKVVPMSSPYTVLADGFYWRVYLTVAGTGAAMMRLNGGSGAYQALPGFLPSQAVVESQSDLPVSATLVPSGNAFCFWIGSS